MNTYYYMDLMFDFHDVFLFDFMRCESSQSCPWYLYMLDGSSEHVAHARGKQFYFEEQRWFPTSLDLIECLVQIKYQVLLFTCAPISEMPSNKSTALLCPCQNLKPWCGWIWWWLVVYCHYLLRNYHLFISICLLLPGLPTRSQKNHIISYIKFT